MPHWQINSSQRWVLLATAAVSSASGLAVELLLGTLASYLIGNQALTFGVAVGGFLAAMGLGSYISQFIAPKNSPEQLLTRFIQIELLIAPLTGILPLGLFAMFTLDYSLWLGLILSTLILGTLSGLEVPLLTRMLEHDEGVRGAIAQVLALDYVGALAGSLIFPLLLLPLVGLLPAAGIIGSFPAIMVIVITRIFPKRRPWARWGSLIVIFLWVFAVFVIPMSNRLEDNLYSAPIIKRVQSQYQRIVLTRTGRDIRLYLDGDLQFSTLDEYRYHESLVHPAMSAADNPETILLLGAGDGLALREVLKWPSVERVLVLELDPAIIKLAKTYPALTRTNEISLNDSKVEIRYADAFTALPTLQEQYDVIIADFPDPDQEVLSKLYSKGFYHRIYDRLNSNGIFATQASSPFFAPKVMACISATLKTENFLVHPYSSTVPSFGIWGYVLATKKPIRVTDLKVDIPTRFLNSTMLPTLFQLPNDLSQEDVEVNRLSHPVIVRYQNNPRWSTYY